MAMQAIGHCKAIQLGQDEVVKRISDLLLENFGALVRDVARADFERWAGQADATIRRPTALLAGFPRTGTTLLEQVLDAHPELTSSEELEVFSRDIFPGLWRSGPESKPTIEAFNTLPADKWLTLRERYLRTMEEVRDEKLGTRLHLDKNPTLTPLIPAFRRLFPEAVILFALRDPRDVVLSCFLRYLPLNTNSVWFLTLERTAQRYAHDMEAWLSLRDKLNGGWLEVRYEDVVADTEAQARRCLIALGLDWNPSVLDYRARLEHKPVTSPTYEAVTKPIYKTAIGRWQNYERYLQPVLGILEPLVRAFGYA